MFTINSQNGNNSRKNVLLNKRKLFDTGYFVSGSLEKYIQKPEITFDEMKNIISLNYAQIEILDAGDGKGLGVFAKQKVLKAGSLIVYGGVIIDKCEYDKLVKSPHERGHHKYITSYEMNKGEVVSWVDAHPRRANSEVARRLWAGSFVNHPNPDQSANAMIEMGKEPFPFADYPGVDNTVVVRITQDVQPGGEVLANYGYSELVLKRMCIIPHNLELPQRKETVPRHISKVRRENVHVCNHKKMLVKKHGNGRRKHNKEHNLRL
jgi:hypothetical protein